VRIPLKGPVLALSAYGDLSYRGFSDLDILIQEHDIARAVATLAELGFRCKRHNTWLKPYLSFGHELDFIRDNGDVFVDLQWRLSKRWLSLPVNSSELWNRAQSTMISGYRLSQLSAEDTILFLCTHGYRHCWSRLIWIMDVAAFLHRFGAQLDGIRLFNRHERTEECACSPSGCGWRTRSEAHLCPHRCSDLFPGPPQIPRLGRLVAERLFHPAAMGPRGSFGPLGTVIFHWTARERLRDRLPLPGPFFAHGAYLFRRWTQQHAGRLLRR